MCTHTLCSVQTVYIFLRDLNDNRPVFDQMFYIAQPEETLAIGEVILAVTATDAVSELLTLSSIIYGCVLSNAGTMPDTRVCAFAHIQTYTHVHARTHTHTPPVLSCPVEQLLLGSCGSITGNFYKREGGTIPDDVPDV